MRIPFFGSSTPSTSAQESAPAAPTGSAPGKGRPTPTRKEAEAARKSTLKVPSDPKEAKKAARARAAAERNESRAALLSGDEKHLPARDAGPVKAFVRDFVDSRWCAAELFLPTAVLVLLVGLLRQRELQVWATYVWMAVTLFIVTDTLFVLNRLGAKLKEQWPDAADRKGAKFYALMRLLQFRRLRLPPPRFRAGGRPAKVKVKK